MSLKRILGIIYSQRELENNNYKPTFQSFIDLLPKRKKLQRGRLQKDLSLLPQAIQPIGEATGEAPEEEVEEEEEEDDEDLVGEIAYEFLNKPFSDKTFGIRKEKGHHYIGNKHVIVDDNDIIIRENGKRFEGTRGLWELIMSKTPKNYTDKDYDNYEDLMIMTNALHRGYDEDNPHPTGSGSTKWKKIT